MKDSPRGRSGPPSLPGGQGSSFSEKPKGTGFPLWILAVIIPAGGILLFCLPCACFVAFRGRPSAPSTPTKEYNLHEEMRFGDLGVTVKEANVRGFSSTSAAGRQMTHHPEFVVVITFKNYNQNRVINAGAQVGVATLEDDVGNRYERIWATNEIGIENKINGQIPRGMARPVRSDDNAMTDALVFGRPVEGASILTLTLDASQYGGSGKVKIKIPNPRGPGGPGPQFFK